MKKSIKLAALLLVVCLMLPLSGCGKVVGRYRVLETLTTQEFSIGYRENDYVRYYVDAAHAAHRRGRGRLPHELP